MDANAEAYAEALENRADAFMKYNDAQKDVEETTKKLEESQRREALLQEDLNALRESGIVHMLGLSNESAYLAEKVKEASETTKGYEAKLSELDQTLLDAETAYVGYKTVISNQDMLIAAKDNQELLADAVLMASNSFQTAESSTKASLERQLQDFTDKYQAMQAAVDAGAPGVVQADVEQMKELVDRSKEELDRLPDVIRETAGKNALAAAAESNEGYRSAGGEYAKKLAEGIDGGKGEVVDAMTDVADETEFAAEDGLSQEVFADVGKQIPAGLTGGITSGKSEVVKSVRRMCDEIITSAKTQLGVHSPSTVFDYIGQMSGKGFITGWAGTVAEMQNTIHSSVSKAVTEATVTFAGIEDSLLSLRDSSGGTISEVVKNAEEAQKALQKIQDGLEKTIYGQINTFDKFDGKTKMSTNELLENMQSQVEGTEQWSDNLRELAERGIDQGLLQKLAEMGPKGAGYVAVFAKMTEEELQKANDLFAQTMTLPEATAESIMQLYQVAGSMTTQGFKDGITEEIPQVIGEVSKMSQGITATIEALIPLADTWSEDMMDGFIQGIKAKTSEVEAACRSVAGTVSDYLHFTRPEKGPLRYYEEWMPHMMQGLEEGIRGNMWRVTDQMAALAGSMDVMTMNMTGGGEQNIGVTQKVISLLETYLPDIASQKCVMMDGKALVGKTVGQMDRKLGQVQALKERIG